MIKFRAVIRVKRFVVSLCHRKPKKFPYKCEINNNTLISLWVYRLGILQNY